MRQTALFPPDWFHVAGGGLRPPNDDALTSEPRRQNRDVENRALRAEGPSRLVN